MCPQVCDGGLLRMTVSGRKGIQDAQYGNKDKALLMRNTKTNAATARPLPDLEWSQKRAMTAAQRPERHLFLPSLALRAMAAKRNEHYYDLGKDIAVAEK